MTLTDDGMNTNECRQLLLGAGGDLTIPKRSDHPRSRLSPLEIMFASRLVPEELFKNLETVFVGFGAPTSMGLSFWLYVFIQGETEIDVHPRHVESLLKAGCKINETTKKCPGFPDGWNCLFFLVLTARDQHYSWEFQSLRRVLMHSAGHAVNIYAKDASGLTIFDHVNALPPKSNSYQRDLWYCALQREGVDVRDDQRMQNRIPLYDKYYTPEHYRALCFLEQWSKGGNLEKKVHDLLEQHPWTEEEWLVMQPIYQEREERRRQRAEANQRMMTLLRAEVLSDSEVSEDEWEESSQSAQELSEGDIAL